MNSRHYLWAAAAATVALAACGGSDDSPSPAPAPAPGPGPGPGPAQTYLPASGDRIEPWDTARAARSALTKSASGGVRHLPAGVPVTRVELGPLLETKAVQPEAREIRLKVGEGREVAATTSADQLAALLTWSDTPDGNRVAGVSFVSDQAGAIRLGVLVDRLPQGAVLRFYGADGNDVVEMTSTETAELRRINEQAGVEGNAARIVWGPDTAGQVSTLEVQVPQGTPPEDVRIAVPLLSHLEQPASQTWKPKLTSSIGQAGQCHQDVMCKPELEAESRSVAKMLFTSSADGESYMCTGTLLNDARSSGTPNFLSAAHCISDQSTASSLVTYWFFHAAACNSSPSYDPGMTRLGGGAQLLFSHAMLDSTLLRLNAPPPAGVQYAGSYYGAGALPGLSVIDIHNPAGDLQKYSVGRVEGYARCNQLGSCETVGADVGLQFRVTWQVGTTESGSSGSAMFAASGNSRYVIGTLWGGSASCEAPNGSDYFGRFQRIYEAGVRDWLK